MTALGLLSGGLDSQLACRVLQEQGIEVIGVSCVTPFFNADRAKRAATALGIELIVADITDEHLAMVKAPAHGYGRNMNPCIDCHAMMFARATELMRERKADFVFSGEVLGQRPMSQNRQALNTVARISGAAEHILRPLSAQLLPETSMEQNGLVDRTRLLALEGRSRKPQLALAKQYGLVDFPSPAGGCLLTDPGFSARLRELFEHEPEAGALQIERLKVGRHYRLPSGHKLIVGRNHNDNQRLEQLGGADTWKLHLLTGPGPLSLLSGPPNEAALMLAAAITLSHSKAHGVARLLCTAPDARTRELECTPASQEERTRLLLG